MIAYRLFLYWQQKEQEDRQERSGRRRQSHFDGVNLDVVEIVCRTARVLSAGAVGIEIEFYLTRLLAE